MSPKQIEVGKTYTNKGAGTTTRKVLGIGDEHRPANWFSCWPRPEEPGVMYMQEGRGGHKFDRLYLSSFASWVGREVEGE